ncbi:hypothetical protein EV702DRAFT_692290 [Suillus placidus]|uniref:Uncharacterized protein n=1 Tax=Suillus placidus TaxID=48579 RepID=A0A9P7A240_9AGAM|nr:hypothetical protein EV702DRAFT_692290 [Suillus placidus]
MKSNITLCLLVWNSTNAQPWYPISMVRLPGRLTLGSLIIPLIAFISVVELKEMGPYSNYKPVVMCAHLPPFANPVPESVTRVGGTTMGHCLPAKSRMQETYFLVTPCAACPPRSQIS